VQYLINPKKKSIQGPKKKKSLEFYSSAFKILFFFFFTVEIILKSFADFEIQKKTIETKRNVYYLFYFSQGFAIKKDICVL